MMFPLHDDPEKLAEFYHNTFESITKDFPKLEWSRVANKKDLIKVAQVIQIMLCAERDRRDSYLHEYWKACVAEELRAKLEEAQVDRDMRRI